MSEQEIRHLLEKHGLRQTQNRIQVLEVFSKDDVARSSQDIESELEGMDRVTLYRTLKSFEESGVIHKAHDETMTIKYALCGHDCTVKEHHDEHAHFHCEKCGKTICIEDARIPEFESLGGYKVNSVKLMLSGECVDCAS